VDNVDLAIAWLKQDGILRGRFTVQWGVRPHHVAPFRSGCGNRTLREATAELSEQLAEARREIEIVDFERENAALRMALAHERKQHAAGIASLSS
jgi:hypothetical protein